MTGSDILRQLEPWLVRQTRTAWKPVAEPGEGLLTSSKFGGTPWTGADAPWPECGNCKLPLPLLLQLDLNNLPPELGQRFGTGLLQLFYCTREECQGQGGWDPFGDDLSRVRVVQPVGAGTSAPLEGVEMLPSKQIVGWTSLSDRPAPGEHEENGLKHSYDFSAKTLRLECPEVQFDITYPMDEFPVEEIAVSTPGDKLAGWPYWVQNVEYPSCTKCGSQMELVFQVDSEDNIPFMFGDSGCGHITQCPKHKEVVAFGWACC
ncbi:MAG: DUF1963 domain-containing protein [Gemmatales bacterium]